MAPTATTVHAGNQLLKQFDIFDFVDDVDLATTPMVTGLDKAGRMAQDLYNWPVELPVSPDRTGSKDARKFGDNPGPQAMQTRKLLKGYKLHKETDIEVGVVAEDNQVYGTNGKKEYEYQKLRMLTQHLQSLECLILGPQQGQQGSKDVAFMMSGLEWWISNSDALMTDAELKVPDGYRSVAEACVDIRTTPFTEDVLRATLSALCTAFKRKVDVDVPCTLDYLNTVEGWGNLVDVPDGQQSIRRFNMQAPAKTIDTTISVWAGAAGTARFYYHGFMRDDPAVQLAEAFFIPKKHVRLRVNQMPKCTDLDKTNLGKQGIISSDTGLMVGNPMFCGKHYKSAA